MAHDNAHYTNDPYSLQGPNWISQQHLMFPMFSGDVQVYNTAALVMMQAAASAAAAAAVTNATANAFQTNASNKPVGGAGYCPTVPSPPSVVVPAPFAFPPPIPPPMFIPPPPLMPPPPPPPLVPPPSMFMPNPLATAATVVAASATLPQPQDKMTNDGQTEEQHQHSAAGLNPSAPPWPWGLSQNPTQSSENNSVGENYTTEPQFCHQKEGGGNGEVDWVAVLASREMKKYFNAPSPPPALPMSEIPLYAAQPRHESKPCEEPAQITKKSEDNNTNTIPSADNKVELISAVEGRNDHQLMEASVLEVGLRNQAAAANNHANANVSAVGGIDLKQLAEALKVSTPNAAITNEDDKIDGVAAASTPYPPQQLSSATTTTTTTRIVTSPPPQLSFGKAETETQSRCIIHLHAHAPAEKEARREGKPTEMLCAQHNEPHTEDSPTQLPLTVRFRDLGLLVSLSNQQQASNPSSTPTTRTVSFTIPSAPDPSTLLPPPRSDSPAGGDVAEPELSNPPPPPPASMRTSTPPAQCISGGHSTNPSPNGSSIGPSTTSSPLPKSIDDDNAGHVGNVPYRGLPMAAHHHDNRPRRPITMEGDVNRAIGEPCTEAHAEHWKCLRVKLGIRHMLCLECKHRWRAAKQLMDPPTNE